MLQSFVNENKPEPANGYLQESDVQFNSGNKLLKTNA